MLFSPLLVRDQEDCEACLLLVDQGNERSCFCYKQLSKSARAISLPIEIVGVLSVLSSGLSMQGENLLLYLESFGFHLIAQMLNQQIQLLLDLQHKLLK